MGKKEEKNLNIYFSSSLIQGHWYPNEKKNHGAMVRHKKRPQKKLSYFISVGKFRIFKDC